MDRILRSTPGTAQVTFYEDGVAVDPGVVNVTVTALSGQALIGGVANGASSGPRTFNLAPSTHTALLDTLTLTWASATMGTLTTTVEVVGGFLFSLADARAIPPLDNTSNYATADIVATRTDVEQALEKACGVAFVPRFTQEYVQGTGYSSGLVPTWPKVRTVRAATIDGSVVTLAGNVLIRPDGTLDYFMGWSSRTAFPYVNSVLVGYEHGYDSPPGEIRRAALKLAKQWLVGRRNPIDDRAITFSSTEGGTYSLAVPGRNGSYFGDPDIDAAIGRYSFDTYVA